MFENLYAALIEKYGNDFNWSCIPFTDKFFVDEAKKEVGAEHLLFDKILHALAKCDANDEVLYLLEGEKYAVIHLTYSHNLDHHYPQYVAFSTIIDAVAYLEKQYVEGYLG